jgi:UDP-N-acetylglucosamine diphosphorylase / glucose-1-phosphate thymidylyltransferase / UDP-N-acetylgalactosamine diphosphorylase / glucosamine-1-phosphate N-acetyltransferase / galactosamine-1-phosphate N-acetyltransferase
MEGHEQSLSLGSYSGKAAMKRIIIRERTIIPPFDESARDLRILNKPLWLLQRDLLSQYCRGALEVDSLEEIPADTEELLVHRDNLFFNAQLIKAFIDQARASGQACQIAFALDDRSISRHGIHLQEGIRQQGNVYVADLFYYPQGIVEETRPLVIDTMAREMGYYHIPSYMANKGDLVFQVPLRAFLSIENWVHVFLANSPFGVFAMGRAHEQLVEESWKEKVAVSASTIIDKLNPFAPRWRNHFLASSRLVKVGKNCSIDPTAVIHGPTVIGNNVTIGAGVTITNSLIGDNVTIQQGAQVMLSVVSDRCFLPWNAAIFMTTLMDNTMIAQLSCLQMCVVGRNTFIGAGNIFTDFHLLNRSLQTFHQRKNTDRPVLEEVGLPVIGSAIGHNVKIGSGFVFYPARMIGSNTTLIYAAPDTVVGHNINVVFEKPVDQEDDRDAARTVYLWPHQIDEPASGEGSKSPIEPFSLSSSTKPRF